jgi:hypothetical protein
MQETTANVSRQSTIDRITTLSWLNKQQFESLDLIGFLASLDQDDKLVALLHLMDCARPSYSSFRELFMSHREELAQIKDRGLTRPGSFPDDMITGDNRPLLREMSLRLGVLTSDDLSPIDWIVGPYGVLNPEKIKDIVTLHSLLKERLVQAVWGLEGDNPEWHRLLAKLKTS